MGKTDAMSRLQDTIAGQSYRHSLQLESSRMLPYPEPVLVLKPAMSIALLAAWVTLEPAPSESYVGKF